MINITKTILKISTLLVGLWLFSTPVMALTNLKVDAKNQASLEASLDLMVADLGIRQQLELLTAMFETAYASNPGRVPYRSLQNALLLSRLPESQYAATSAKAFLADRRMDSLDPAAALTRWKATGWSRNESYLRFLLDFGEAVDGKSGHELIESAQQAVARAKTVDHAQAIKDLEKRRMDALIQLQKAENRQGACSNPSQMTAREDIENMDKAIAAMKASQRAESYQPKANIGLARESCNGYPEIARFSESPATPEIASGRQQAEVNKSAKEIAYQKAISLLTVTQVRTLEFASKSRFQAQLEARADVTLASPVGKVPTRVNYQMILTPKAGGDALYFRGRLPALGQSGNSGENVQLFTTVSRPDGLSDQLSDYEVRAVVTELKYQDGTRERLVPSLGDFKAWWQKN